MSIIPARVSSTVALTVLKTQKHSPTLLFAAGVGGVITAAVLASRATLKLESILVATNERISDVEDLRHDDYSEEDRKRDKAILYVAAGVKIVKLYAPAVAVGTASVAALTGSHFILNRRNAALTAAYATLGKAMSEYRSRVIEDLGEEKDRQYRYGGEVATVTETDDKGKKTQVQKKVGNRSPYGVLFHEGNPNWNRLPEYNLLFIRSIQNMATERLKAKGYLFLNDVLDDLGFERTKAGQVVGWLADGNGDGYVDFGIFDDVDSLRIYDFITGREGELYLDFNVDGVVYDHLR